MSSPLIIFLILIIAIGAFFFGRWHGISQRSKALSEELKAKDDELNALKSDVNKHFDETARLFSNVTEEYKALYQHLATSSNKLSNRKFDLKLSSHTSGLVGLGNDDDNSTNNEVIDSQATEVSDYATGSQQPRDYADDDMDDEYNPKQPSDDNEQKSNDSGNSSSEQDSEGSDIAIDDSSDSKSAEQPPSGEEVKPDKSTS